MNVDGRFAEMDTVKEESENDDAIVDESDNNNFEVEKTEADNILSTTSDNEERGSTTKVDEDNNPTIHFTIKVLEDISIPNVEGRVELQCQSKYPKMLKTMILWRNTFPLWRISD